MFVGQNEEARIAKEVEAHEKRIRKELEKQDMMRRKVFYMFYTLYKCFRAKLDGCEYR